MAEIITFMLDFRRSRRNNDRSSDITDGVSPLWKAPAMQTQTAQIIDLASYRKAKSPEQTAPLMPVPMASMPVAWMPVWIMVPVPVMSPIATA